ncbi:hypothetical protein DF286_11150 [Sphingosinicella humi]|uniref:Uncharacterized protein n=1 Tax=Allosphingosinicella humi TaxID=2068657 RepID=A0A2U2J4T3_9SPHN|nr:hypothetical protein DF286_11150 [Sphingosinicella humi]
MTGVASVKYREFYNSLLRTIYEAAEVHGPEYFTIGEMAKVAELPLRDNWIARFSDETATNGHAQVSGHMGPRETWKVRIRAPGSAFVEEHIERDRGWGFAVPSGDEAQPPRELGSVANSRSASSARASLPHESQELLVSALKEAEDALDSLRMGNSEKSQARAYIVAALSLAESPEPPADLIWEIVNRASQISGIAALFVSIVALFVQ